MHVIPTSELVMHIADDNIIIIVFTIIVVIDVLMTLQLLFLEAM